MKANELRIGNLVNEIDIAFTITEIYKYGVQLENDSIPLLYSRIHEIEPIPLTEEWLLKFGFEKYKGDISFEKGGFSIYLGDTILSGKNGKTYFYGFPVIEESPKHVHQLQNLYFALTGEELTLKEI